MNSQIIHTNKAPAAIGPYSQGVIANNFLFISGQIPVNPDTGEVIQGDIVKQTKQCMHNLEAICQAASVSLAQIVKTTVYITNLDLFSQVNEAYGSFFPHNPPARVCVEVSRLPKDVLVEIDAIATLD